MPPLRRPSTISRLVLPPREAVLAGETDVLVVGGGPAGLGAALGAADAGARVILAERYGFLGGNATAALVMPLMSWHTQSRSLQQQGVTNLLPNDHGEGHPVVAGVVLRLLERLVRAGGALAPTLQTGYTVPFDPETFKIVALDLLESSGVAFLLHSFASGILQDGPMPGVIFETKSGPLVIRAHSIVDATGDGDIAVAAGAAYDIGRDPDGLVQPMTLMFRIADFERQAFENYVRTHPGQWKGVHGLWDLIRQATEAGELRLPREDFLFFATPHPREISVNSTRITRTLGTDVWDLTCAEFEARQQMRQMIAFFRKYVPGFEEAYVVQSGVTVGIRETRRIRGLYRMTAEDVFTARKFEDVVARGSYPVDIHNPEGKGTILKRLPEGEAYDIPLRALLPDGVERLLVAGRCISGTHEAHSSYRVMPIAMATGQAAGTCAALASRTNRKPHEVPADDVQEELIRQGANLGRLSGHA